jgi:hypothetical protein
LIVPGFAAVFGNRHVVAGDDDALIVGGIDPKLVERIWCFPAGDVDRRGPSPRGSTVVSSIQLVADNRLAAGAAALGGRAAAVRGWHCRSVLVFDQSVENVGILLKDIEANPASDGAIAMSPIAATPALSNTGSQLTPPLVVFHTPSLRCPTQMV